MSSDTTPELDNDLVRYVRTNGEPLAISEAAADLAVLGKCGAAWPRKSKTFWEGQLRRLAREGKLAMHDGGRVYPPAPQPVALAPQPKAGLKPTRIKPPSKPKPAVVQGELF